MACSGGLKMSSDSELNELRKKFLQTQIIRSENMNECEFVFAYGSNLNQQDWKKWCDRNGFDSNSLEYVSTAVLPDMKLCFDYFSNSRQSGVLDIQIAIGHIVYGVIFKPSKMGWEALDRKEGAPYCYTKRIWRAVLPNGTLQSVIVYEVIEERKSSTLVSPSNEYFHIVEQGLTHWKLSTISLKNAAENQDAKPEINHLFVYGTLMREESRFKYIEQQDVLSIQNAKTKGVLHETTGNYPAMRLSRENENSLVVGELVTFENIAKAFPILDSVEGFRGYNITESLYHRTLIDVQTENGNNVLAWTYVAFDGNWVKKPIVSGCWKQYLQEKITNSNFYAL